MFMKVNWLVNYLKLLKWFNNFLKYFSKYFIKLITIDKVNMFVNYLKLKKWFKNFIKYFSKFLSMVFYFKLIYRTIL